MVHVPPGGVTVLLGSEADRRRMLAFLADTAVRSSRTPGPFVRRVVASPALPVARRTAFLDAAASSPAGLVVVARASDGLGARERRAFLDHLRVAARGGAGVVVDDADPVAALAVADHALRCAPRSEVVDVDDLGPTAVARS